MKTRPIIRQKIFQCIDEGLQVLGESSKKAVYCYLRNNFGLKRDEIPIKTGIFFKGLKMLFGEKGANTIQRCIIENLRKTFNLKHHSRMTLAQIIDEITNEIYESSRSCQVSKHRDRIETSKLKDSTKVDGKTIQSHR